MRLTLFILALSCGPSRSVSARLVSDGCKTVHDVCVCAVALDVIGLRRKALAAAQVGAFLSSDVEVAEETCCGA